MNGRKQILGVWPLRDRIGNDARICITIIKET